MQRTFISTAISSAVIVLAGFSCNLALANSTTTANSPFTKTTTQLPRTVRPSHYAVSITPDAAKATFTGRVVITLDVLTATSSITLNATDLTFQHGSLSALATTASKGKLTVMDASNISINANEQTATLHFAHPIAKGSYTLAIDYSGLIGDQANGFFLIDYDTPAGKKRALYTQFENSDARRFIPSWDEPNYKASFSLDVTVPGNQMAVSNMPVATKTVLADGRSHLVFAQTPIMSTYLLFFGLGDFERATDSVDGTEVGVVTQSGALAQAAFPLAASKAILHEYNDYFGVPYPLPKLDNVAAPGSSQFFSAMENWGAIFTFERGMLLDPAISTQRDKETSFIIVAHEMAHQWFGDLVTMRWWDDLWLNEGFASWMENRITNRLHPEWNNQLSVVGVHQQAMHRDSLASTHPVVQHVATVEQASQAFDEITYNKGESVIHMLESYVGEDDWRAGVRAYMKKHAYSNTTSDDFWHAIAQATSKPILDIAHDFTLQPGVPMIKVNAVSCQSGVTSVSLSQSEFSRDLPNKKPLSWHIPVIAALVGTDQTASTLVSGGKATLQLNGCGPVVVNAGQSGYYRTLYAPALLSALATNFSKLKPIDQLGLLADSWALSQSGLQPMADFMNLANAAPLDADPQVWTQIADDFVSIHTSYSGDQARQQRFDEYAIARLTPKLAQLTWNSNANELSSTIKLREALIDALCELNDTATIAHARELYVAGISSPDAVPTELRKAVARIVASNADQVTWDKMHAAAKAEKSPMIKDQMYDLLAISKDPALSVKALELAMTEEPGATNSAGMIDNVAYHHPDFAFDFCIAHLSQLDKLVDSSSRSRYLPRIASGSAQPSMINKLNSYAKAHLPVSARRDVDTAIANIQFQIKVRTQRLPEIDAWLAGHH